MSDKTNRKSGAVRRQEQLARESKEKKKVQLTAIIVFVVLAVLFGSAMLINSDYLKRHSVAVSAGDLRLSPSEFGYFYNAAQSEYQMMIYQSMPDYAEQFLPQQGIPLEAQVRSEETGETWADFFKESALTNISRAAAIYADAKKAGFTLSDEKLAQIDEDITGIEATASMYGFPSLDKYLKASYGKSMTVKVLRGLMETLYIVDSYQEHVREAFNYSDDELMAYYNENKDMLDTFTYRYMHIGIDVGAETDYATTEEYEQAKTDAIAEALVRGEEIAAGIKSEQDFIDAARAYNAETYELDDSTLRHYKGEVLGDTQGVWLRAPERKEGDVTAIEFSSGCYVEYFISRSSNDYNIANLRQLVIRPDTVSPDDYPEGEDDTGYTAAVAEAKNAAKEKAELVFAALSAEGATEEKFIELVGEYSADTTVEGGLYENVYRYESEGRLVTGVNEWPFAEGRKAGDFEMIITEDGTWYILYLSSFGELYNRHIAGNKLREQDYNAWDEAIGRPEVKKHWAYVLTK